MTDEQAAIVDSWRRLLQRAIFVWRDPDRAYWLTRAFIDRLCEIGVLTS